MTDPRTCRRVASAAILVALVTGAVAGGRDVALADAGADPAVDDASDGRAGDGAAADAHDRARVLLDRARVAMAAPHSGLVTMVSFTEGGPRVTALEVVVRDEDARLSRPPRVLVGTDMRWSDVIGEAHHVPTSPLGLDVDAIMARWEVTVGDQVQLDTGTAVPVELIRRQGAAIRETLFVDTESGIAVRRETRDPDGRVLRVVAYTSLTPPERTTTPGDGSRWGRTRTGMASGHAAATAAGFDVALALDGGFVLVAVEIEDDAAIARYSDGLSVVSVYQQHGTLDPDGLEGAVVHHVGDRDVWTWPGLEPARLVWTGDGRTWTAVSDAPAPVIEDALSSLPGDLVGHDAPHRLQRGLHRVWRFVTAPLR